MPKFCIAVLKVTIEINYRKKGFHLKTQMKNLHEIKKEREDRKRSINFLHVANSRQKRK